MATVAEKDQVVQPSHSAWHSYWEWGDDSRTKVRATSYYLYTI